MKRLAGERMVSFAPHRGAVVSELSYGEVVKITEIRVCLETMAMRESLPLLNSGDPERAEEIPHTIDHEKDLVLHWGELNRWFHATLFAPADRPQLIAMVKVEHEAFERYICLALSDYGKPQRGRYELPDFCRRRRSTRPAYPKHRLPALRPHQRRPRGRCKRERRGNSLILDIGFRAP